MRRRGTGSYVLDWCRAKHRTLGFFAPFVETGAGLPCVESPIHQYLADLVGQNSGSLAPQCLATGPASRRERMIASAQALVELTIDVLG